MKLSPSLSRVALGLWARQRLVPPARARAIHAALSVASAADPDPLALTVDGDSGAQAVDALAASILAATTSPLSALLLRAHDESAAEAIALGVALAHLDGAPTDELLALLPAQLPCEEVLHLAALLRIAVVAELGVSAGEDVLARAATEAVALLAVGAPASIVERACDSLSAIAEAASPSLRNRIFSEAVVRLFASVQGAARAEDADGSIDDIVRSIMRGDSADEPRLAGAAPYRAYAACHAVLVGRIIAVEPGWWPALWEELEARHGGLAWGPLPSLFGGIADAVGGGAAMPRELRTMLQSTLLQGARAGSTTVRQTAIAALAASVGTDEPPRAQAEAQGAPDEHRGAAAGDQAADALGARADEFLDAAPDDDLRSVLLATLQSVVRDPVAAVRAQLAEAPAMREGWAAPIIARLVEDTSPSVRAAAGWSALRAGLVSESVLRTLEQDLAHGNPATVYSAAMAAACAGCVDERVGMNLAGAVAVIDVEDGPAWSGLSRWAGPAWPLSVWASSPEGARALWDHAVTDDDWLVAAGHALASGWTAMPLAPEPLRDAVRERAMGLLADADLARRGAAAVVLGRHMRGEARLLEVLQSTLGSPFVANSGAVERPSLELLATLSILAPRVAVACPSFVPGLLAWLDDDDDEGGPQMALACLGELALPDDEAVAQALSARVRGDLADEAWAALARLVARR